jgi:glucose/arabinose dehydrogenase
MILSTLTMLAAALITQAPPANTQLDPGVTLRVYRVEPDLAKLPTLVADQTPNFDELRPTIDFRDDAGFGKVPPPFVSIVSGWINVTQQGAYEFRLTSDDGSRMSLDAKPVIDHDGRHAATAKTSGVLELAPGLHALRVEHFDHGGKKQLTLDWRTPGEREFKAIPTEALRTEKDLTRVTGPGVKQIDDGKRPGDGKPVTGVHPAWTVTTIRPQGFEPMVGAMCFDAAGRLIVGTFNPLQRDDRNLPDIDSKKPDKLFAITGATGDPAGITVKECATDVFEPCGLCAVGDVIYVSHRKQITRLRDADHDGYYETHETVGEGWEAWNYHQFTFGLVHRDGHLYATLSTAMAPPPWEGMGTNAAPNGPMRGGVLDVDLSSDTASVIAGGLRAPNGIGIGPENTLWYCDNQGAWMPCSEFNEVVPGRFYGHHNRTNFVPKLAERFPVGGVPSVYVDRPRMAASVLLPYNELSNSPTQPQLIPSGTYAGQMYIGELTGGGIRRTNLERVNGQWQGAVFQFTQGLESGVNRMIWGPDGNLYVGGIGAGGNWNWRETKFGLQRLSPSGKTAFEMLAIHATAMGFEVTFTKPVATAWLNDAANFAVRQWTYTPTAEYGGPKIGEEKLVVTKAVAAADGRSVTLEIPGLKRGHCVSLRMDPVSAEGEKIWSTEAWYTLNEIPRAAPVKAATIAGVAINPEKTGVGVGVLPPAEAVTLMAASADAAFHHGDEKEAPRDGGRTAEELDKLPGFVEVAGTHDLISNTAFGDARLHVEWYCPPGGTGQQAGNSGVYLQSLYEIQVLGTLAAEKLGREEMNDEAASIYKVKTPDVNASAGPGQWQAYDIWFKAPRFEGGKKVSDARVSLYWNGVLVHNDVAIAGPTGGAAAIGEHSAAAVQTGPLRLQDHETKAEGSVRFRNIWMAPLEQRAFAPGAWEEPLKTIGGDGLPKGWVVRGGKATFRMDGGTLVGTTAANSANTFLVSEREYGDFELLADFTVDPKLNSGIQVRSEVKGGFEKRDGVVSGMQVEIDPAERMYTGGIYEESGRGWLYRLIDAPYARRAFRGPVNGVPPVNHLRVVAMGPVVRTWINGVPAGEVFDAVHGRGHLGLQVHGVGAETSPLEIRFSKMRIRELSVPSR